MITIHLSNFCLHRKDAAGCKNSRASSARWDISMPILALPTGIPQSLAFYHTVGCRQSQYAGAASSACCSRQLVRAHVSSTHQGSTAFAPDGGSRWLPWVTLAAAIATGQTQALHAAASQTTLPPAGLAAVACQRLSISCFYALCALFTCYSCSWFVDSRVAWLQQFGQWFNANRKAWCSAMGWAHVVTVIGAAGWYYSLLAAQPANLSQLYLPPALANVLSGTWPLLLATSLNLVLLGFVELRAHITRKAMLLRLDEQAPGRAHSHMVQGAQSIGRVYVLATLLAACVVLSMLDIGRVASSVVAAVMLMAGATAMTEEEVVETQLTRAVPARQQAQQH